MLVVAKMESLALLCAKQIQCPNTIENLIAQTSFPSPIKKQLHINVLYQKLQQKSKYISTYNTQKKENILLCGSVQSGKTNEMLMYCWWSIFVAKRKVVFVTRNIRADKVQLEERIDNFNNKYIGHKRFFLRSKFLIICLANHIQTRLTAERIHPHDYNLCIDEADFAVKSRNNSSRLEKWLSFLEHHAKHQIGATATQFAVLSTKKSLTRIIELEKPTNYHGIDKLRVKFIKKTPTKNSNEDPNIDKVYQNFLKNPEGIMLHSTTKLKLSHNIIMNELKSKFPMLTTVTYNGTGINVRCYEGHNDQPLIEDRKRYSRTLLNIHSKSSILHHFTKSISINDVISILKEQGHKHIVIISGHLASRGISFVSNDYKYHLTHQYYKPGPNAHGETILQGLRILGCYNDNPKLTLWCSPTTWKNIKEQYTILQKYCTKLKCSDNIFEKFQSIKSKEPSRRLSRRTIYYGLKMKRTKGSSRISYTIVNDLKDENTQEKTQENTQ